MHTFGRCTDQALHLWIAGRGWVPPRGARAFKRMKTAWDTPCAAMQASRLTKTTRALHIAEPSGSCARPGRGCPTSAPQPRRPPHRRCGAWSAPVRSVVGHDVGARVQARMDARRQLPWAGVALQGARCVARQTARPVTHSYPTQCCSECSEVQARVSARTMRLTSAAGPVMSARPARAPLPQARLWRQPPSARLIRRTCAYQVARRGACQRQQRAQADQRRLAGPHTGLPNSRPVHLLPYTARVCGPRAGQARRKDQAFRRPGAERVSAASSMSRQC